MKTKKSLVVLAVITLVFALVFTTCSNGGGGGGNQGDQSGTQGQLAFERITSGENAGTWRVRKGTFKGGALVIPAYYNGSTGRAARGVEDGDPVTELGSYDDSEGYGAFTAAGITSLEIPDTVRRIGGYAFMYNPTLIAITIPASVTEIWFGSFVHCDNLKTITVAAGNPNYSSEGGILYTNIKETFIDVDENGNRLSVEYTYTDNKEKTALHSYPSASGSVTIKEGVTKIHTVAIAYNKNITSVTIPNSVTFIEGSAFTGCDNLTSVTIGAGVTFIGTNAFIECSSLTSITVDPGNLNFSGEDGMLYSNICEYEPKYDYNTYPSTYTYIFTYTSDMKKTALHSYPSASGSVAIKEGVTCIWGDALSINLNITSVTIPSSVTKINRGAFWDCRNISNITIPASVEKMGDAGVFGRWTSSQTINIEGYANQAAADAAWGADWRAWCNAKINYNG